MARRQLLHLEISEAQIRSWLDEGYLYPQLPGVYGVGHAASSDEASLTAAVLWAGPGAMLGHATAVWWLRLADRGPSQIEVCTPRRCRSRAGIVVHGRCSYERIWHRGLPVAPVPQTLLDYAADASPERLARVLAEAEYQGWLELESLHGAGGSGRRGTAALRRALERHEPQLALSRSELERRLLELCRRAGMALPELNVTVEDLLVDALWRAQRVIVELDGRAGHQTWSQIQRDRERDLRLRAAGYLVLRYVWRQLERDGEAVLADLRAGLSWAGSSAAPASR